MARSRKWRWTTSYRETTASMSACAAASPISFWNSAPRSRSGSRAGRPRSRPVARDGVQHERAEADVRLERLRDRLGDHFAVTLVGECRNRSRASSSETSSPSSGTRIDESSSENSRSHASEPERLLRRRTLLALGEQVRPEAAARLEVVARASTSGAARTSRRTHRPPRPSSSNGRRSFSTAVMRSRAGRAAARTTRPACSRRSRAARRGGRGRSSSGSLELVHRLGELLALNAAMRPAYLLRNAFASSSAAVESCSIAGSSTRRRAPRDPRRPDRRSRSLEQLPLEPPCREQTPSAITPSRYATWISSSQPTVPSVRSRIRSTPW